MSTAELHDELRQVWPEEVSESEVPGLLSTCRLKTYQKQSLAFMLEVERSPPNGKLRHEIHVGRSYNYKTGSQDRWLSSDVCAFNRPVNSGLLCDSVGLGKTLVCISLVLANPAHVRARMSCHSTAPLEACNRSAHSQTWASR